MVTLDSDIERDLAHAQAQPIEFLVCGGGGAKGAMTPDFLRELDAQGILDSLVGISGSSYGGICAGIMACGVSVDEYSKLSSSMGFKQVRGEGKLGVLPLGYKFSPFRDTIRNYINKSFFDYCQNHSLADLIQKKNHNITELNLKISQLQEQGLKADNPKLIELNKRLDKINKLTSFQIKQLHDKILDPENQPAKITFADLEVMHLLDPVIFKELHLTGSNQKNGELIWFNANNTPDVEIVVAMNASLAYPRVINSVTVKIDGTDKVVIDGGALDNMPQKPFLDRGARILVQTYNINGNMDKVLHGNPEDDFTPKPGLLRMKKRIFDFFAAVFTGMSNVRISKQSQSSKRELRENSLGVLALDAGKIKSLDFDKVANPTIAKHLALKAQIQTQRYLYMHNLDGKNPINLTKLEINEFILDVYENYVKQRENKHSISKSRSIDKQNAILDLISDKKWQESPPSVILLELIELSIKTKKGLSVNSCLVESILKILNNPSTSDTAKSSYICLLMIDYDGEPKDYVFTKQDIINYINNRFEPAALASPLTPGFRCMQSEQISPSCASSTSTPSSVSRLCSSTTSPTMQITRPLDYSRNKQLHESDDHRSSKP